MTPLEKLAFLPLGRPHRAAPPQLGLTEAIDVVGRANEQVQIEGPVLAVLEGPEAVENEGLGGRFAGSQPLVEEQAVSAEALGLVLDGAVVDTELAADLAQARSADQTMKEPLEEVGVPEPVGG